MNKLIDESYNFEQVDSNPQKIKYDFVSVGENEVPKRVSIVQYQEEGLRNFYNLALSNISINEKGEEEELDMSRDNNKNDGEKVLKTSFVCALDFLTQYKDATIIFRGNTHAKQRLYKMSVNNNFEELSKACNIMGGYINNLEITVDANTSEKQPANIIDLDNLVYENYTITESSKYHFITFQLKDEFKND